MWSSLEPILVREPARMNYRALGALGRLDPFEPTLDPLKPAIDVVEAHRQARVIGMEPGDLTLEPTQSGNDLVELLVDTVEAILDSTETSAQEAEDLAVVSHQRVGI